MNDNVKQLTENIWRRAERPLGLPLFEEADGHWWWGILVVLLAIAFVYVVLMYLRDGRSIGWFWGTKLAILRCTVYGILALAFMMPAKQTWNEVRKESRVIYLLDVTQSLTDTRDEMPRPGGRVEDIPTRQDYVQKLLTDDKTAFLKKTLETNPVFAYRFGRFADENYLVFEKDGVYWTREQWEDRARPRKEDEPAPAGNPLAEMDWTSFLSPGLKDDLDEKDEAQRKQVERLRRMRSGTNIGDSVSTILNRELNNMVQGIVIVTDGHSTEGTRQAVSDVAERAKKAQIPIFVVAVGEDRPPIRIDIADVRSPDTARPDDPFKINVTVQGVGLPNEEVEIFVDVYKPGDDKKPFKTETRKVKFKPGQPPRVDEEFEITPEEYGEETTEQAPAKPDKPAKPEDKKPDEKKSEDKPAAGKVVRELPEGIWKFIARVPRNAQEPFTGKEHVSDKVEVKVVRRPLRVLMFASAPTRDYQFIRTLMVREVDKGRVDLCIHLQPAPGAPDVRLGRVQDVPPQRLLSTFPSTLKDDKEVADGEERFNNLGSYDLILAFDPDWTRLDPPTLKNVEKWAENGGGLIIVAGPINTLELSKPGIAAGGDREKLKPILDLYPVILEDARIKDLERKTEEPYRLNFPGANDEMEFLKLNEEEKAAFRSSWTEFFDGPSAAGETPKGADAGSPLRGFYNYYPVKRAKDKAIVIATFADQQAALPDGREMPYLVTASAGKGRVVWVGSGETWRLRQYREAFHERFWTKLARYAGSGNVGKLSQRIDPNMGQIFPADTYVTAEAKFLDRELQPIPRVSKPEVTLELPGGIKDIPTRYTMTPRSGGGGTFDGWFSTRFLVKSPGEYKITFESPETKESITRKFLVKESNPELDNTRPDYDLMYELASEAGDVLSRINDPARRRELLSKLVRPANESSEGAKDPAREKPHLLFEVKNADLIPSCMLQKVNEDRIKGQVKDRWDVWWVLGLVVGLLGWEWLTRKLLRLA